MAISSFEFCNGGYGTQAQGQHDASWIAVWDPLVWRQQHFAPSSTLGAAAGVAGGYGAEE